MKAQNGYFVLARVDNLVKKNGWVLNKLVGAVIGMLSILSRAPPEGTLNLLHKAKVKKESCPSTLG